MAARLPSPSRRARIIGGAVLLALLGASAVWVTRGPKTVFETAAVKRGNIEASVTAIGTLQPHTYVDVGAQVSGQITRLHVQPGSAVEKGQLLAEIDPSVQQATVDAGRAALAGLRAQLADQQAQHKLAGQQHVRQQQMAKFDSTPLAELETAEATLASAAARINHLKAQIDQTQATLKADEARLGYTRIYAPMAGSVVGVEAKEGQTLNATYQTPNILRIADLSAMTVWTEVSEADVRRVRPDMAVYFTTLGGDQRRWSGKVRQVLPAPPVPGGTSAGTALAPSTSKVILYTVLFDVDNADGELMPQMTAQVVFVTAAASNVLAVPLPALAPSQAEGAKAGQFTARVLGADGKVDTREVMVGVRNRLSAEVLQGLREGELLVTGEQPAGSGPSRFQL
ncbi:efflux RND transporter periplasmic adaptor subunit [Janthinobacterium aquaticum]|uniref:efflux RND transporter periplasmic adaptor subunit n=1 Tax=Janthinobacterium sp. FT58W TaxID=2654254 RepID=UPI0012640728|nr:efflux RND transporter periplasmic adaptor subunit [Janthinobacterium sp. FT58W]KAB8043694.1 efflux RND transporter periplasmic adaptor subunit [Janthinobacterium sp. FT58W]